MNSIELEKLRPMFPNAPESFFKRQVVYSEMADACLQWTVEKACRPDKRIRQSAKPIMNKLEQDWFSLLLKCPSIDHLRAQAIKFKIGNNAFYKPDITGWVSGRLTAWECKGNAGKNIDRGKLALKVAASAWPDVEFILVWRIDGIWKQQLIVP